LQLQTAQHALQQQQPVAATPAPQPTLKLSQPDKYGGRKGYVSAWLSMIEDAFVETRTDAERMRWATSFLSDDAATWWNHVKYSDDRPLTWDDFKEGITNHFESSRKVDDAHENLLTLRQEGSVSRYVSSFQTQLHLFGDMVERDKVLYFKRGLRTYIQAHVRVQDPQTLSKAIKIAESADLGPKDHRFSHRNDRYSNPSNSHHTSTSQAGPSSRGPTPMEIGNVEIRKSNTSELSRKYNKSPAELNVMRRQGLCFKCGKKGHTVANCSKN
jgi:Ty3 transposon capsid-like protein